MAEAGVKVKWTDKGLSKLTETLEELGNLRVTVGFQGEEGRRRYPDGGPTVAAVAKFNEFGTRTIPARGFMRRAVKRSGHETASAAAEGLGGVVSRGEDPVDGLGPVGAALAEGISQALETTTGWATPNAPSTVEEKGPGKPPLHDTGLLARSVTWAVREGRAVKKEGKP